MSDTTSALWTSHIIILCLAVKRAKVGLNKFLNVLHTFDSSPPDKKG